MVFVSLKIFTVCVFVWTPSHVLLWMVVGDIGLFAARWRSIKGRGQSWQGIAGWQSVSVAEWRKLLPFGCKHMTHQCWSRQERHTTQPCCYLCQTRLIWVSHFHTWTFQSVIFVLTVLLLCDVSSSAQWLIQVIPINARHVVRNSQDFELNYGINME